jgi:putative hemolysin
MVLACLLAACGAPQARPAATPTEVARPAATDTPSAFLPNPASAYCEQQGHRLEIRTASDGSQRGVCVFADGSECDEWAYYRGECSPAPIPPSEITAAPTVIPTALPIDPAGYQGWWTYTHAGYGFSIMLPEDWVVEEITTSDPAMNGHTLNLHPRLEAEQLNIRLTFRRAGEETLLWPTGVGQGEFVAQGTLDVAGQPARRMLLVCPNGEVTSIWYHDAEAGQPNIARGGLEFGSMFSAGSHCEAGLSLSGKVQRLGEMIIASLQAP